MNSNTISKGGYIFLHIWWGLLLMGLYRRTCFRVLEGYTLGQSKAILWALVILAAILGISTTYGRNRNYLNLVITLLLPFELYTAVLYKPYYSSELRITFIVTVSLIIAYFGIAMTGRFSKRRPKWKQLIRRATHWMLGTRTISVCCGAWFLSFIFIATYLGNPVMRPNIEVSTRQTIAEQTIDNSLETVMKLDEDVWEGLAPAEKLNVLQTVANIERGNLGIPGELNVGAEIISNNDVCRQTYGYYNDAKRQITIDLRHLENDSPEDIVDTLCHEVFHAYEHSMVAAYDYLPDSYKSLQAVARTEQYKREFSDYLRREDFGSYYYQAVECDARQYAEKETAEYFTAIRIAQIRLHSVQIIE